MKYCSFFTLIIILSIYGCKNSINKEEVKVGMCFMEILNDKSDDHKGVFIFYNESGCGMCDVVKKLFLKDSILSERIDLNYNYHEYKPSYDVFPVLSHILHEHLFPVFLFVDCEKNVKGLFVGANHSADFLSVFLDSLAVSSGYISNYKNRLELSNEDYGVYISNIIKSYFFFQNQDYKKANCHANLALDMHENFYSLYLNAKTSWYLNDKDSAYSYAKKAVGMKSSFSNFLYEELREELFFIIGENEKFSSTQYDIVALEQYIFMKNKNDTIKILLKNLGKKDLIYGNIQSNANLQVVNSDSKISPKQVGTYLLAIKEAFDVKKIVIKFLFDNCVEKKITIQII